MKLFFLVLARDEKHVDEKIRELKSLGVPYVIVCGKKLNHPNIIYRKPKGKYDAINFGAKFVPRYTDLVVLNDVDTRIGNIQAALGYFNRKEIVLVFAKILVKEGPQRIFYMILDPLRRMFPINASGELMLIRYNVFKRILPIKPCKSEDNYILFKILELRHKTAFCEECNVETERTKRSEREEEYKRINVTGMYQALFYTRPPPLVKLFYILLPFFAPLLLVLGKKGYYWTKGILLGFMDYIRGDRSGMWTPTYMD